MAELMKAVIIDRENGFGLKDALVPLPEVGEHDVLVRVEAAAINPADRRLLMRARDNTAISILGFDACGTVVQRGSAVQDIAVGDQAYYAGDVSRAGCFAEYQAVRADLVGIKPKRLPEVEIIASASRAQSRDWCLELGAHRVIDHSLPLASQLPEAVSHAVLASHPDGYLKALPPLMQPFGHIACIVPLAAAADLNPLMQKSLSFHWEYMFTKPLFRPVGRETQGQILNRISRWLDEGLLRSTQSQCLGAVCAESVQQALTLLAQGNTVGKLTFSNT